MPLFEYAAEVVRAIDGDTIVADIDLGFSVTIRQTLRLYGINAPEIRGSHLTPEQKEKGWLATQHLCWLLDHKRPIIVRTIKDRTEKYGRYLAVLYGKDSEGLVDLNQQMIRDGYAVKASY
jgi:micrococcal nuclease